MYFSGLMQVSKEIIKWYKINKRNLPWREETDPFKIWLSEVILQQTRVEQGLPYYQKFTHRYKNISQLANAKDDEVMKLWQGLGYYSRAVNMLNTARIIAKQHKAVFPRTYDELIKLKGIGPYTAAAIASFAYDEPKAVLDGNVYRVLSRLFEIKEAINSSNGKKVFSALADEMLSKKNPGIYNQGIMELGALVCKPRNPLCEECPVKLFCNAYKNKTIYNFPVKSKKAKPRERFIAYFLVDQKGTTFIKQRLGKGIWKGLYELPNIELEQMAEINHLINTDEWKCLFDESKKMNIEQIYQAKHQLTHQTIFAHFYKITSLQKIIIKDKLCKSVKQSDLKLYAVSRLFDKFLNYLNLHSNQ